MQLPDINVLIYAHRKDAQEHEVYARWLVSLVESPQPFALSEYVLSGFVRIVTNPKIFDPPTPMTNAIQFCDRLLDWPHAVLVVPRDRHRALFAELCRSAKIKGALVSDAYLAALAIEHGCELLTTDSDFAHFEGLRFSHPLSPDP